MRNLDLVICKHLNSDKLYLFEAPVYSQLKAGCFVMVDTVHGESLAEIVEDSECVERGDETYRMLMRLSGAKEPLRRVLKYAYWRDMKYEEEKNE